MKKANTQDIFKKLFLGDGTVGGFKSLYFCIPHLFL